MEAECGAERLASGIEAEVGGKGFLDILVALVEEPFDFSQQAGE
ncbi:hypothetical protein ACQEVS_24520 [Streptomyces sp. CA-181903]